MPTQGDPIPSDPIPSDDQLETILLGVSTIFESLGRGLVCLNSDFHIVHASSGLDDFLGEGTSAALLGKRVGTILGSELFGPEGTIRKALRAGNRREGWGATFQVGEMQPRLVSITAAPVHHKNPEICDPRVAYVVVVRPTEEDFLETSAAPTIFSGLVARSTSMLRIFSLIEHLAESDATILISGESGTGKELVARALHVHSPRRRSPFVAVNCGALPGELLESELFGHVRGAFTGAVRDRHGRFELANGGTIFLDEIGDMPLHLQVKLLRVLQEKTFERVGDSQTRDTDARIIAATNKDLQQAVVDGEFREDLFYRLRVVPITIPPLRDRREDIEPLVRHLFARVSQRHDRAVILSPDAMRDLLRFHWPGNVRELENALEYAVAVCQGQTIHPQDLPLEVTASDPSRPASRPVPLSRGPASHMDGNQPRSLEITPEYELIRTTLDNHHWRRAEAAEALGMSRTTLWRKMRELGLVR